MSLESSAGRNSPEIVPFARRPNGPDTPIHIIHFRAGSGLGVSVNRALDAKALIVKPPVLEERR